MAGEENQWNGGVKNGVSKKEENNETKKWQWNENRKPEEICQPWCNRKVWRSGNDAIIVETNNGEAKIEAIIWRKSKIRREISRTKKYDPIWLEEVAAKAESEMKTRRKP